MSYMSISSRPSSTLSWADDDDDFDFESWKATADISAPTIESLPPLQHPASETDIPFTFSSTANESAPWAAPEPIQQNAPKAHDYANIDWRCGAAMLTWRALADVPQPAAYPEINGCEGEGRVSYSSNWGHMKVDAGVGCRRLAMFRASLLRQVMVNEVEILPEMAVDLALDLDGVEIPPAEVVDLAPDNTILTTTDTTPCLSPTPSEVEQTCAIGDEGYHSGASRPISPTLFDSDNDLDTSTSTSQVGLLTAAAFSRKGRKHQRHDSMDSLNEIRKRHGADDEVVEIVLGAAEDEALDVAEDGNVSPALEYIDKHPDISTYISNAATKSWAYASGMDWKTLAIVAVGVVLGGAMHITRRR
jgi:hypothetical protein